METDSGETPESSSDGFSNEEEMTDEESMEESDDEPSEDEDERMEQHWQLLKNQACNSLEHIYQQKKQKLMEEGHSEDVAEVTAHNQLVPRYQEALAKQYEMYLKVREGMEYDDIHEKVMKTMDKLMDEEDYDADEAIHAAVKRRKSLLKDFVWKLKIEEES